jgi:hypothetical protein
MAPATRGTGHTGHQTGRRNCTRFFQTYRARGGIRFRTEALDRLSKTLNSVLGRDAVPAIRERAGHCSNPAGRIAGLQPPAVFWPAIYFALF